MNPSPEISAIQAAAHWAVHGTPPEFGSALLPEEVEIQALALRMVCATTAEKEEALRQMGSAAELEDGTEKRW